MHRESKNNIENKVKVQNKNVNLLIFLCITYIIELMVFHISYKCGYVNQRACK